MEQARQAAHSDITLFFSFHPIHDAPTNSHLRGFFIHLDLERARGKKSPWAGLAAFQRLRTAPMSLAWKKASNQKAAEEKKILR
jgi:hypothetical protein